MVLGIERNSPDALELIVELLSRLYRAGIVTKDQMQQVGGVERRGEGGGRGRRVLVEASCYCLLSKLTELFCVAVTRCASHCWYSLEWADRGLRNG